MIGNQHWRILNLEVTSQGSTHDRRLYQEAELTFPDKDHCLLVDLGFQGIDPDNIMVVMPEKKPKGRKISPEQKSINTLTNSIRVKVEYYKHDIAGVKRCCIKRNQVRLHSWK